VGFDVAAASGFVLSLPTELPAMERARPPPQLELDFADPEWDDDFHSP